jgi:predicted metal-dependent hydrolase
VEQLTILVDGVPVGVSIERKRVKNINARLHGAAVRVSAPLHLPMAEIERAIPELARTLLRRARAGQVNNEEDALLLARRIAMRFPHPPAVESVAFVTSQHACWGSYSSRTRRIHLHAALRTMPRWVLEAIVAHELAHVVHLRHTKAFWALLRSVCPTTDRARAFLEGVSWLGRSFNRLPPVERALLVRDGSDETDQEFPCRPPAR